MSLVLLSRHLFFGAVILASTAFGIWYGRRSGGRKIAKLSSVGNCKRWNISRGKVCTCGKHITVRSVNGIPISLDDGVAELQASVGITPYTR